MVSTLEALKTPPEGLFWSEPLSPESDFKKEDPLALDYLGQQVGLWLFRGFTTRTGRAQYYAVVLYGLNLADKAVLKYGYPGDDGTRTRLFERWERFWALATLEFRAVILSAETKTRCAEFEVLPAPGIAGTHRSPSTFRSSLAKANWAGSEPMSPRSGNTGLSLRDPSGSHPPPGKYSTHSGLNRANTVGTITTRSTPSKLSISSHPQ